MDKTSQLLAAIAAPPPALPDRELIVESHMGRHRMRRNTAIETVSKALERPDTDDEGALLRVMGYKVRLFRQNAADTWLFDEHRTVSVEALKDGVMAVLRNARDEELARFLAAFLGHVPWALTGMCDGTVTAAAETASA